MTISSVLPSAASAHREGGRGVRTALRPSAKTVASPRSTALAPRTTSAATNGAGDSLAISTTATSPTSATGAPYTRCTASPPGTRIDGLHHRHAVDQVLAHRRLARRAHASGRRRRSTSRAPIRRLGRDHPGAVDGGVARASEHTDRRSAAERIRSRSGHERPWSSAFASRSMSSGTSSAGRRPS